MGLHRPPRPAMPCWSASRRTSPPCLYATLAGLCAEQRPFDSCETVDRGRHGRQEHRRVEVFDTAGQLDAPWQTLIACVARVSRLTYTKNTYEEHPLRLVAHP